MVDIWLAESEEAGFPCHDPEVAFDAAEVSNVDGACYGVSRSIRATFDSLVNENFPVLGSVNRGWAQQILDLWQGEPRS